VDSPQESIRRVALVDAGIPEPRVQVAVRTAAGVRHADLGWPEHRLLLEYQGDEHRASRRRWLDDLTRVQLLEDAGYRVILVGAADLDDDARALAARIRCALA
jgi:very-short-patch-repair endonuclease